MPTTEQIFTEVFPINTAALPALTAYRPVYGATAARMTDRRAGSRLAARLRGLLGSYWFWTSGRLITDGAPNPTKLIMAVDAVRAAHPDDFGTLETVEADLAWTPSPMIAADYALRWPLTQIEAALKAALAQTAFAIKHAQIERQYHVKAWVVDGRPALSLSIDSRLLYEPPIHEYAARFEKIGDLAGFLVADKTSTLTGEITRYIGTLGEHRDRLLGSADDAVRALIAGAPDDRPILRVDCGQRSVDFVSDALWLVIRPEDIARFDVAPEQAAIALHLNPRLRAEIIKRLSDVLKAAGLIDAAFSTATAPALFFDSAPRFNVVFGGGKPRDYDEARLPYDFEKYGPFRSAGSAPLRLTVLDAHPNSNDVTDFLEALRRTITRACDRDLVITRDRKVRVPSPANLESGVRALGKEDADLMLIFLPDSAAAEEAGFSGDTVSGRFVKAQTIGRRHPCLIVSESIMHQPEAMLNVIIGLLGRSGDTPYALDEPLPYADRVAGLSVVRFSRKDRDIVVGLTRLYKADGVLMRWIASRRILDVGAPIPESLLADLFPKALTGGKRVIVHYDSAGASRRDLLRALGAWEDETNASFLPVFVTAANVPRLYRFGSGSIHAPAWGMTFRLNQQEAFVVTTAAGLRGDATPQPLHIATDPPLTIDQAIHSVMTFTRLHFGALHKPRLPITLHNADLIATALERGIFFDTDAERAQVDGELPFWL